MKRLATIAAACCLLFVGACGDDNSDKSSGSATTGTTGATGAESSSLPQGSEPVKLDPADFTTKVDNPYWPMARGSKWEIRSSEEHVVVKVTNRKKDVAGIDAVVLSDTVTKPDGTLVEVTDDWYAQDSKGNIWYLGEDTKEYENGKVSSTKGSWEHGVNGAYAGIIIPADPKPGLEYRQEYYKGEAEDQAKVLRLDSKVTVPAGTFEDCLETEDTTPLEPDVVELKYYAKGVGPVLRTTAEGRGREELVTFTR